MRLRRLLTAILLAGAAGLGPGCAGEVEVRDQWVVHVSTDAPTPQIVDRALVEVLSESGELACADCRRQLGVPTDPKAWPISFGIEVPASGTKLLVRVRLYRARRSSADGTPTPDTALDTLVRLPDASGKTDVSVAVRADCLGVPVDLAAKTSCVDEASRARVDAPTATLGRPPADLLPGSWPRATRRDCAGAAPDGMVCIPGGFFVLGGASLRAPDSQGAIVGWPERFVQLSPFFVDREEMRVGDVRALLGAGRLPELPEVRDADPTKERSMCTFLGAADATNDALPVNCMSHLGAEAACGALGKRLPTEAEWEYVARELGTRDTYVWAEGVDACEYTDVGLGASVSPVFFVTLESSECRIQRDRPTRPRGPTAPRNERDVTTNGVFALAGNLSEWVADDFERYSHPCWKPEDPFLFDPKCEIPITSSQLPNQTARGSSWADSPALVNAHSRQGFPAADMRVGFRCVKGAL